MFFLLKSLTCIRMLTLSGGYCLQIIGLAEGLLLSGMVYSYTIFQKTKLLLLPVKLT
ncbi:hypothetical protein [Aeromonas phage Akh-2]|nr:hypothetical protein [Aeromonas phage Akh-2]